MACPDFCQTIKHESDTTKWRVYRVIFAQGLIKKFQELVEQLLDEKRTSVNQHIVVSNVQFGLFWRFTNC